MRAQTQHESFMPPLWVLTLITPTIVGNKVGMSPLAIILAVFAGGQLLGLLGILLAVPGAAVIRVLMRRAHAWALERA